MKSKIEKPLKEKKEKIKVDWEDVIYVIPAWLCTIGLILIAISGLIAIIVSSFTIVTKIVFIGFYLVVIGFSWAIIRDF